MSKSESCDQKYILHNLENIKGKADKVDFISNTLERCAIPIIKNKIVN